jgi:hypothetical protein
MIFDICIIYLMDIKTSEIDNKRTALETIIKEKGSCSCVQCEKCPLQFYLKRSDGSWLSCAGAVETIFGSANYQENWAKLATKILGELEVEEMLGSRDDS